MEFMNIGHRGAKSYAPENTMLSFNVGLEMGVNGLETDVRQTKDGFLVLSCDDTTERCSGVNKIIRESNFNDLYELDFGKGQHIALLEDFLKTFGGKDLFFAIELKQENIYKQTLEYIRKYVKNINKVTITSFEFENLVDTRNYDKEISLGYLTEFCTDKELDMLTSINAKQICPKAENITTDNVKYAHDKGLIVRAWGIADENDMEYCLQCGVDGMTINFPDKLTEYLKTNFGG